MYILKHITLILIVFSLLSCEKEQTKEYVPTFGRISPINSHEYIFGIHPLHNPKRLHLVFGPLITYLSEEIPEVSFKLEASRNYAAYDEKLYAGKFHFSLPNPYQTINSLKHGYKVFGKMGDDENFCGIILTRKDSDIKDVKDLLGKAVSFPAPTALAATMMPQYLLYEMGLDINKDIDILYVGSQESSIMNVFLGNTAAAATWPPPWLALAKERPELRRELEIKWQTAPLLNNGLVVRNDVPQVIIDKVSKLLFNLHKSDKGRNILENLELSKFESASNDSYTPVLEFLKQFDKNIRHITY